MPRVEYWLTAFRRDDEELAGEWPLKRISQDELRGLFDVPEDEEMYGEYEVGHDQAERLGAATGEVLDLERLEYFVGSRQAG